MALKLHVFAHQIMSLLFLTISTTTHGFTVDLIRSNSSRSRLHSGSPYSDTFTKDGEYLMKLQIGTPPLEIAGVADTGSDLIWMQCLPCESCPKQDSPMFDPTKSSTYRDINCGSSQCPDGNRWRCESGSRCPYKQFYEDRSYSIGTLGSETFTLGSTSGEPFTLQNAVFGCGHNNSEGTGIIGLGWGPTSLTSQMGDSVKGLFAYCLGKETSKINFGENAVVSGDGVSSTKLFRKSKYPSFYFLNLEAVSVNGDRVETSGTSFPAKDGNIVIDSGTRWTYLPRDYYVLLKEALNKAIKVEPASPPRGYEGSLCYKSNNLEDFPVITAHFTDVDLVLDRSNSYDRATDDVICFAFDPTEDATATFGHMAHFNFLVGYDTQSEIISFKPTDCSGLWS